MSTHYAYSDSVQPGDTVWVRWGRFGNVAAKVLKVYADGGLSCVRWNKRRECYTAPKRYYRTNNGLGWIEHDQADRTKPAMEAQQ